MEPRRMGAFRIIAALGIPGVSWWRKDLNGDG
jgi:hypothetical protein